MGGAKAIAQSIIPTIEQAGGVVITQRRVTEILLESGTAVGVKAQNVAQKRCCDEISGSLLESKRYDCNPANRRHDGRLRQVHSACKFRIS